MIWASFIAGVIVCAVFLYVPGFVFLLGLGFSRVHALVLAPVASLFGYCVLGIVYAKTGTFCSWASVALPVLAACCIPIAVHVVRGESVRAKRDEKPSWRMLLLFVAVGLVVTTYMYVTPLASPDAFLQEYDDAFHLNVIHAFVDSGSWSVLDVSKYLTSADQAIAPMPGTAFYPALWHLVCALVASLSGCSAAFAVNVVNFTAFAVAFPSGMMLMLSTFLEDKATMRLAAFVTLAFAAFPWFLLYWGTLYANAFALALTPLAAALFIRTLGSLLDGEPRAREIVAFLVSVFVLVVAQTSTIFFCIVFLAPYGAYRMDAKEDGFHVLGRRLSSRLVAILFVLFVVVVWTALFFSPFMSGVISYDWAPSMDVGQALVDVVFLRVKWLPAQWALAIVVLVGIAWTLRHREFLWLTIAYLVFCVACVLCAATDGFAKHFLAGFWYTDLPRVCACLAIPGAPLAALGMRAIGRLAHRACAGNVRAARACATALLVVLCVVTYFPNVQVGDVRVSTALGSMRDEYFNGTRHEGNRLYSDDEQAFVNKVVDMVPEGELVVNVPNDGSIYAYAVNGLRTYYRDYQDYDVSGMTLSGSASNETRESKLVRMYGAWAASNDSVRDALEAIGARYVLVLDQDKDLWGQDKAVSTYRLPLWVGLSAVTDDTPGFEVVLSEGDMRLYEIVSLDES